jgi:DNA-binding transcriptional ArsR family regulator
MEVIMNTIGINCRELADYFSLFSDETRLRIIIYLLEKSEACCVNKISEELSLNQPAVSQQMRILRNAKVVTSERDGKFIRYKISDIYIKKIIELGIKHFKEVNGNGI